ncbi:MAG: IS66 family insertion sequence element accessory protein TnpB [Spirochaetes bacterium]|nr:IS66 family insertion sequence element accessory protein TnpB [Spirochaetota bacterium]
MLINLNKVRIFLKPGTTDMRKQINGLSIIVEEELEFDPFSGHLFMFCNRQRKILKVIYWDKNGFCMWQKRLEKYRFPWPENSEEAVELSREELLMLLSGIDFFKAHKEIKYRTVL